MGTEKLTDPHKVNITVKTNLKLSGAEGGFQTHEVPFTRAGTIPLSDLGIPKCLEGYQTRTSLPGLYLLGIVL